MSLTTFLLLLTLDVSTSFTTQTSSQIRLLPSSSSQRPTFILNAQPETKDDKTKTFFMDEEKQSSTTAVEGSNTASVSTGASRGQSQEILDEASDALSSVGWSAPMAEAELTSDDPFVKRINDQIQLESGVDLDELLNPAKVRLFDHGNVSNTEN